MSTSVRVLLEKNRKYGMLSATGLVFLLPFAIGLALLYKAWPLLAREPLSDLFLSAEWSPIQGKFGLFPFLISSVMVALLGLIILIPFSLAAAIYITQYAHNNVAKGLRYIIDILAGIPSIIFGIWGVITVVPLAADIAVGVGAKNTTGYCLMAGAVVAAFSVLPFILNMLIELMKSVSVQLKEVTLSLGTTHWQLVKDVILKELKPGIIACFSLGVSKMFGETIAVLMVVGNVVQVPKGIWDAGYPLPALLANNYGEMMTIPRYDAALMLSALILFAVVVVFNLMAHRVIRYYKVKV